MFIFSLCPSPANSTAEREGEKKSSPAVQEGTYAGDRPFLDYHREDKFWELGDFLFCPYLCPDTL
jgi:hypothetical protein